MRCSKCGANFVRYPCPSCGAEKAEIEKIESYDEESLVKPSDLDGKSAVNPLFEFEEPEKLVKPSELLKKKPVVKIDDKKEEIIEESLVKPSEVIRQKEIAAPDKETGEESLLKPSEVIRQKSEEKQEIKSPESLLKPSEVLKEKNKQLPEPEKIAFDENTERLVRPSQLQGKAAIRQKPISTISTSDKMRQELSSITHHVERIENDVLKRRETEKSGEYKNRVKSTLEQVIGLLEKLVDQEE